MTDNARIPDNMTDSPLPHDLPHRNEAHQALFEIYCMDVAARGAAFIELELTEDELRNKLRERGLLDDAGRPAPAKWMAPLLARRR